MNKFVQEFVRVPFLVLGGVIGFLLCYWVMSFFIERWCI